MNISEPSTEQFAQRVFELGLINDRDFQSLWASFGTRDIPLQSNLAETPGREAAVYGAQSAATYVQSRRAARPFRRGLG